MDDFGVKYTSKSDANHLIDALKESYDITIDWSGKSFCGLDLEWDYEKEHVDISMKHFVKKTLQRLQHVIPSKPQYAPHQWTVSIYGQNR